MRRGSGGAASVLRDPSLLLFLLKPDLHTKLHRTGSTRTPQGPHHSCRSLRPPPPVHTVVGGDRPTHREASGHFLFCPSRLPGRTPRYAVPTGTRDAKSPPLKATHTFTHTTEPSTGRRGDDRIQTGTRTSRHHRRITSHRTTSPNTISRQRTRTIPRAARQTPRSPTSAIPHAGRPLRRARRRQGWRHAPGSA